MACSEARLAANRANAQKSTGPQTDEGKDASRRNSLRHGLTGAGVVIPGEDAAAVARQAARLRVELAPDGHPTAVALAERVALLIVRLERSARHELAATADRALDAALDFDEVRRAEADRLFDALDEGSNRADLLTMPEGVDLLRAALADLRAVAVACDPAGWSRDDAARLTRCLSPKARAQVAALLDRSLVAGDPSAIDRGLVALIDAERASLESLRPTLNHATIARLRDDAVSLVLVGDDPATLRARRYEASSSRELYRALRAIREFRQPAPAAAAGPPSPSPAELAREANEMCRHHARVEPARVAAATPALGSFCPAPSPPPAAGHKSTPPDASPAPRGQSRYEDRKRRPKLGR